MSISDAEYRGNMECSMEDLAFNLTKIGVIAEDDTSHTDCQLVELTARKMVMMHDILKAYMPEEVLKAVMKG